MAMPCGWLKCAKTRQHERLRSEDRTTSQIVQMHLARDYFVLIRMPQRAGRRIVSTGNHRTSDDPSLTVVPCRRRIAPARLCTFFAASRHAGTACLEVSAASLLVGPYLPARSHNSSACLLHLPVRNFVSAAAAARTEGMALAGCEQRS